jgi:DNA polymerase elongation subunit (family B)
MLPHQKAKFITVRIVEPDDHSFIYATYLRNNWYSKENTTTLRKNTWMSLQQKRIENVLKTRKVLVASLTEDPDVIVGYAFEDGDKPFFYVKLAWRNPKLGIDNLLLEDLKKHEEQR